MDAIKVTFVICRQTATNCRSSVVSLADTEGPGWRVWRQSRRSESRRGSVVSISGEDHGVKSMTRYK